ncbi:MAG: hypothetical protein H2038_03665 [Brevundimonas sp.]|jgi:hypothetical protein|uniref:hypothetical protein n=1 Tax=Brevundimonas sp. TaxID=1871086 RepID=UPI0018436F39|nr:hypothetical protein [Brevundimonas sp.]MBA4803732.1 hypothetical protein [Brevundimonas sp.]
MRSLVLCAPVALALAVSACATAPGTSPTYGERLQALADSCRERGGILVSRPDGRMTGQPETDHVCNISGGGTRIPRD